MLKRIVEIIKTYDTEPVEIITSLISVWFGMVWLLPGSSFTSINTYQVMSTYATENQWGAGVLLIGILGIMAAGTDNKWFRFGMSFVRMILLVALGVLFLLGNPLSAGSFQLLMGLVCAWCAIRIAAK